MRRLASSAVRCGDLLPVSSGFQSKSERRHQPGHGGRYRGCAAGRRAQERTVKAVGRRGFPTEVRNGVLLA